MTFLLSLILATTIAYGQGHDTGRGGTDIESKISSHKTSLEQVLLKLKYFFETTPQLQEVFPEFKVSDFIALANEIKIEVVDGQLLDHEGTPRTCLNFRKFNLIKCNLDANKDPEMVFTLLFHEILSLMGVEETSKVNATYLDGYKVSSRLGAYVIQVSNFDVKFEYKNVLPESMTGSVTLTKNAGIFGFKKLGLKSATITEARIECLSKYNHCEVMENTYYVTCHKRDGFGAQIHYNRECSSVIQWKGRVPRNFNVEPAFVSSDEKRSDRSSLDTQENALSQCFQNGFLECRLVETLNLITRSGMQGQGRETYTKALVLGARRVNLSKNKIFSSWDMCKDEEAALGMAMHSCLQEGLQNCRVYTAIKDSDVCGSRLVIGNLK